MFGFFVLFFVVKQKTAYEMRISDWSSDVCSSDLPNSNRDSQGEEALKNTLHALKAQGCTVILIAHRINVLQHVDKVLVLRDGVVHKFAPRDEVDRKRVV